MTSCSCSTTSSTHLEITEPVDNVFHLASPASPIDYLRLPLHTLKVGAYGTHNALGLAKRHRARFLIASTSEVYGDPLVHPQPESYWGNVNPIGPRGVYDEAKRYAEAMTMAYHRQQGVDTAIVRIFNTYGPRMRAHDGRAIPTFVRQALEGKQLTVFGDGSQTRSFCYVSDLIAGIVALSESSEHEPVNIGNPSEFTLLELANQVLAATGSTSRDRVRGAPGQRPAAAPPRHLPCAGAARLGAAHRARRGTQAAARPVDPGRPRRTGGGSVMRRVLAACGLMLACVLGVVAAASAADAGGKAKARSAATPFLLGIEDNAQILGNNAAVTPDIEALAPQVFRFTIFWSQIAKRRPAQARNSDDPAYDWSKVDAVVKQMNTLQMPVLLTIVSTPAWAGGGGGGLKAPKRMLDLQDFAYAAADRYNGTHVDASGATLPKVVRWEAWNEPNLAAAPAPAVDGDRHEEDRGRPVLLRQDVGALVADDLPRHPERDLPGRACRRHGRGRPGERRREAPPRRTARARAPRCPGFAPLAFLRDLVKKPVSLDVWSHHPYRNQSQNPQPYKGDNVDVQGMPRLYAALNKAFPGRKILVWVTEFGAQTNPPDKWQGVSLATQAKQLSQSRARRSRSPAASRCWSGSSCETRTSPAARSAAGSSPGSSSSTASTNRRSRSSSRSPRSDRRLQPVDEEPLRPARA